MNFAVWKFKASTVLIKNAYEIALQGKKNKPKGIINNQIDERNNMALAKQVFGTGGFSAIQCRNQDYLKGV